MSQHAGSVEKRSQQKVVTHPIYMLTFESTIHTQMGPAAKGVGGPSTSTVTKYKRGTPRWNECTDAVTTYLVKEMVPFNTVKKPSFKTLLRALDRRYVLPDRKYFSHTAIPDMYSKMRKEVQVMIYTVHVTDHSFH